MDNFFAKEELNKYLKKITSLDNFEIKLINQNLDKFNDSYDININLGVGEIKGSNKRSVLLGVYDFLKELGCIFTLPGTENEIIPILNIDMLNVVKKVKPKYKYRTICLEGSTSIKHITDMIDYLPKNGFNGYFIQFKNGHEFFERWYEHKNNIYLQKEEYSYDRSVKYTKIAIEEIKKRDLLFHSMGHGFTMETIGLDSTGWQKYDISEINDDVIEMLALVDGKRKFYKDIPMNTQLCYSNLNVRNKMIDLVLDYLIHNPHVDILHLWLADEYNNFCECEECKKKLPSDYYVMLLNELDQRLTKLNIDTKISFLAYYELLYPPKEERFNNEDRFIMMFAPITRTYTASYDEIDYDKIDVSKLDKFNLNKNVYPDKLLENLGFLKAWKNIFKGDSFLFDYHLMWDEYKDYPGLKLANILYRDINYLDKLGFDGFISCQVSRNFFPTALSMNVLSNTLLKDISFKEIVDKTFKDLYGKKGEDVYNILKSYSNIFSHFYARKEIPINDHDYLSELLKNYHIRDEALEKILELIKNEDNEIILKNLKVIHLFVKYANRLYNMHISKLSNYKIRLENELNELFLEVLPFEEEFSNYFDGFYMAHILKEFVEYKW